MYYILYEGFKIDSNEPVYRHYTVYIYYTYYIIISYIVHKQIYACIPTMFICAVFLVLK